MASMTNACSLTTQEKELIYLTCARHYHFLPDGVMCARSPLLLFRRAVIMFLLICKIHENARGYRLVAMIIAILMLSVGSLTAQDGEREGRKLQERLLTQYLEYQNIQVTGTVSVKEPNKESSKHDFVMRFGASVGGKLPPQDIRFLKPNPGEPHIKDELLTDTGFAFTNSGISVQFNRRYVSRDPISLRRSDLYLNVSPPSAPPPFDSVTQTVLLSVEGVDPRLYWTMGSRVRKATGLEIIGNEEFLGFPCMRVRFRINTLDGEPNWVPVVLEALVATKPTIQVLKVLSVVGGPPNYLDNEMKHSYLGIRSVESIKQFGDWLICDRIVTTGGDYRAVVSITDVQPLPTEYQGLWDYNTLTGCIVGGTAEPSTRKASGRIPHERSKEFTVAPHTDEELKLIRSYVAAKSVSPVKPRLSTAKIGLILVNVFAAVVIVYYLRKVRRARI